jgi:uncharacterized repeat protein (TIGR03803 family)
MVRHLFRALSLLFVCALMLANAFASAPQNHTIKYVSGPNGAGITSTLISDAAGNLYGTTLAGGGTACNYHNAELDGCGTIFELSPDGANHWTYTVLHEFQYATDGDYPYSGLVMDASGNLYGTAVKGGDGNPFGPGTAYELSPPTESGGAWTFTTLYTFGTSSSDGFAPWGTLIFDQSGNLYGTTQVGGANSHGTVYELSPPAAPGGAWTESILWTFPEDSDGGYPLAGLYMDSSGNLYGTTSLRGYTNSTNCFGGCGTVFKLSKGSGGEWTEEVLHGFRYTDGATPWSKITFYKGSYYGTTSAGGSGNEGTVFQLTPSENGSNTFTTIHDFTFSIGNDGGIPYAGVIFDQSGNLYGTTFTGGPEGSGTVYELTSATDGTWTETILASFLNSGNNAEMGPIGGLLLKGDQLFGTTADCTEFDDSCNSSGHIFSITGF